MGDNYIFSVFSKSEIKSFYENLFKKKITDIDNNSKLKIYKTLKIIPVTSQKKNIYPVQN